MIPARRAVLRALPLLAVRWTAQLKLEMTVRNGDSAMQYLHFKILKHRFPSIVLASPGEQEMFHCQLLQAGLSEALTKAATLHQDLEFQADFVLLVLKPEADVKLKEVLIQIKYPDDEMCNFENMYVKATVCVCGGSPLGAGDLRSAASRLQQLVSRQLGYCEGRRLTFHCMPFECQSWEFTVGPCRQHSSHVPASGTGSGSFGAFLVSSQQFAGTKGEGVARCD